MRLRVAWHAPVSARGEGDVADARPIRNAVSLELLGEESSVKYLQPFQDRLLVVLACEGFLRQPVDLGRFESETQNIIEIKKLLYLLNLVLI